MWGRHAEYAWAMPSTPASGRRVWVSPALLTLHPLSFQLLTKDHVMLSPNAPAMTSVGPVRPEAPREQGQGGVKQRALKVESDKPEFKFCLCHFLGVGPGTSCLTSLRLFPSLLLRLIIYTLGQLAQGLQQVWQNLQ